MSDRSQDEIAAGDEMTVDRRGLLVKGGLAAAGATFLASPAAAFARGASANAGTIKVAVVTHGDTGSFWSVFKKGVDQAAKDLTGSWRQRHAGLCEQRRRQAGGGSERGDRRRREGDRDLGAGRSALKDPLTTASKKGIEIITVNSGLGAFDSLPTYEHRRADGDHRGARAAVDAGRRKGSASSSSSSSAPSSAAAC